MNGAESLVRTLKRGGVDVCFANPGTSEMHFVAALDMVPGIKCVLALFEGCVTGAADGYGRMMRKPAVTLLHLGPGLSNGEANLHNARKARTPIVNIVGEHATYHRQYESPLSSDIDGLARPLSAWVRMSKSAADVGRDAADAIAASMTYPGQIATLILPADTAWTDGGVVADVPATTKPPKVGGQAIDAAKRALSSGNATLVVAGSALLERGAELAVAIGVKTGARVLAQAPNARVTRGAGHVAIDRIPNPIDSAIAMLKGTRSVVLAGALPPVAHFAYPGKPSFVTPPDCEIVTLATPVEDVVAALEELADAVGADPRTAPKEKLELPVVPTGAITYDKLAATIGALIPENAIISDESVTTGRSFFPATLRSRPHDWLQLTGGAIGSGIPMAIGAAVACPDRKVINFESDGSAMFTVQGLWTQARENLNVLTVIWSNRAYSILRNELKNVRAGEPGPTALSMLSLGNPDIGWVSLAKGLGVEGTRVDTIDGFADAMRAGLARRGPFLIEVVL
jgi:acetolactate synthase-1/2/3 large subunit